MKKSFDNVSVSVLIPAYNHENYVVESIKSVISQTYQNIELLIIDDGSQDGTYLKSKTLLEACEARFVRTVLMSRKNEGVIRTLNELIQMAKGEFVVILASDDKLRPTAVTDLLNIFDKNEDCVLAVGDNTLIDDKSNRIFWDNKRCSTDENNAKYRTFGEALGSDVISDKGQFGDYSTLLIKNYIPNGYMIRRASLLKVGMYSEQHFPEDWNLHLKLCKLGKFEYTKTLTCDYRWHKSNTVKSDSYRSSIRRNRRFQLLSEKSWAYANGYRGVWDYCWSKEFGFWATLRHFRKFVISFKIGRQYCFLRLLGRTLVDTRR